jgi:hypothetical protein
VGRSGGNHVRSLQKNQISKVIALEQWHLKEINSQKSVPLEIGYHVVAG